MNFFITFFKSCNFLSTTSFIHRDNSEFQKIIFYLLARFFFKITKKILWHQNHKFLSTNLNNPSLFVFRSVILPERALAMNQYFAFFCGIRFMTKFGYERGKNLCSKSYFIKNRKITRKKAIFLVPTNKTQNVTQKWKKK